MELFSRVVGDFRKFVCVTNVFQKVSALAFSMYQAFIYLLRNTGVTVDFVIGLEGNIKDLGIRIEGGIFQKFRVEFFRGGHGVLPVRIDVAKYFSH